MNMNEAGEGEDMAWWGPGMDDPIRFAFVREDPDYPSCAPTLLYTFFVFLHFVDKGMYFRFLVPLQPIAPGLGLDWSFYCC